MAGIDLIDVRKSYGAAEVMHGIDLTIRDGAFTVFVGPSGCGKSTLLRMMAGLEEVTSGEIRIDNTRCDHLMPSARGMAMVFQSYALYPHMTVAQNMRFGLENTKMAKDEITRKVAEAAEILQISELLDRRPGQLSGGQSQRVAIGRAIVKDPRAFLFDEPLSNLDAELRVRMRGELVNLHRRLGATMIYVTHDQVEAMTMADEIVVLRAGRVEQVGPPVELYARPQNLFVAGFLGAPNMNMLPGQVTGSGAEARIALDAGFTLPWPTGETAPPEGSAVTLGIRPEHLEIGGTDITGRVAATEVLGAETIVHLDLPGGERMTVASRGIVGAAPGDEMPLGCPDPFLHCFDAEGRAILQRADWKRSYIR